MRPMPRFDAQNAEVSVFTFKEGLLSAVAHDLKLKVGSFHIDVADDRSRIEATFDPRSIRVACAMIDGRESPSTLSDKDKTKIEGNITSDVIPVGKHPEVRFQSSSLREDGDVWVARGSLTLAGKTRDIDVRGRKDGERVIAEVVIHQPDFGIKPYSAMLGTLKIQADIKVRISIPL
jgi:polyisoprenoid-binding protein YceI